MQNFIKRLSKYFYRFPIITTLLFTVAGSLMVGGVLWFIDYTRYSMGHPKFSYIFSYQIRYFFYILPAVLTLQNIVFLFSKAKDKEKENAIKRWEVMAIIIGTIFSLLFPVFTNMTFNNWDVQLYNYEMHTPIETNSTITIGVIIVLAIVGYIILRFYPVSKLPPLLAVFCISALYLGIGEGILWCIQIFNISYIIMLILCIFPINCILIAIRTIRNAIHQEALMANPGSHKFSYIRTLLSNTTNWPWLGFIAVIPLLSIIVMVLLLFGQEPDSIIKAWTETADWNMSQKVPPQNIFKDEHYLCTVAAGGHPKVVKPIRTGKRHGRRVLVNRQLCIANAFEQLIEERVPSFHRFIRTLYDKTGYPIAKHIKSPYVADVIYFIMKPLEWIFLISLYLFDIKPENRISVQYPHSSPPGSKSNTPGQAMNR